MTLYGIGLGPGDAGLVTLRGRNILDDAEVVYSPGRLSESVAAEHVPEERIGEMDFPMTRDEEKLRSAWKDAAAEIAPRARNATVAFVTLGDPNIYSTFGHLRRTLSAFHPAVTVETIPGVSAVTAFTTALGVEISAGASLSLHEAARGTAPTGPDRMVLFKVTDVPATHEQLTEAGYDVVYGRRLYMEQGETVVTEDPAALCDRDYYTLAYAQKQELEAKPVTAEFETEGTESETAAKPDGGKPPRQGRTCSDSADGVGKTPGAESDQYFADVELERAIAAANGDIPEVPPR